MVLQRLFTTFPGGLAGIGLLLLRLTAAGMTATQGAAYLSALHGLTPIITGLVMLLVSILLAVGLLTPVSAAVLGVATLCLHLSLLAQPTWNVFEAKTTTLLVVVMIASVCLLGPGSFSFDSYLFGRREIIIPRRPDRPQG
jgi:uncharacterized membrane protein YphA (DoxX/SURF4 family)